MDHLKQMFLSRAAKWDGVPALAPLKIALMRTLKLNDDIREHHAKVAKDAHLSPIGRSDSVRKYIAESTAREIRYARKAVETAHAKLAERKLRLQPPAPPSDPVSIHVRGKMQDRLSAMTNGKRVARLMAKDADPVLIAAALEVPNWVTGIEDDLRAYLINAAIEKAHPGALAAIEQANEAIDLVHAATRVATDTVVAIGQFPSYAVLDSFIEDSVKGAAHIDASVERDFATLAEIAA